MKILFNTKVRNVFRIICMEESELNNAQIFWEQGKNQYVNNSNEIITSLFFFPVVKQHRIVAEEEIELQLLNSLRAPIDFSHVPILVSQHKHDPNFYIEIRIDSPGVYVEQTEVNRQNDVIWLCVSL